MQNIHVSRAEYAYAINNYKLKIWNKEIVKHEVQLNV